MAQQESGLTEDEIAEFNESLTKNFDVLPLFERQYNDFVRIRRYSLDKNEKLRNGWHNRVLQAGQVSGGPIQMPNINDYHFHNNRTKFLPSHSQSNYPRPHLHLAPGPGVDKYGQKPIPDDMMLRKLSQVQSTVDKNKTKRPKKEQHGETKGGLHHLHQNH